MPFPSAVNGSGVPVLILSAIRPIVLAVCELLLLDSEVMNEIGPNWSFRKIEGLPENRSEFSEKNPAAKNL